MTTYATANSLNEPGNAAEQSEMRFEQGHSDSPKVSDVPAELERQDSRRARGPGHTAAQSEMQSEQESSNRPEVSNALSGPAGQDAMRASELGHTTEKPKPGSKQEPTDPQVVSNDTLASNPPLPDEAPPLPNEAPPREDDGWMPIWDYNAQNYYFYNRFTQMTQWENPRVPEAASPGPSNKQPSSSTSGAPGMSSSPQRPRHGGYDPKIHGDYDPNAWYAVEAAAAEEAAEEQQRLAQQAMTSDSGASYAQTGAFNRFTGRWQASSLNPENFNDENKARRQMNAYFDVDAAANSHDGRSLKAERQSKKLTKQEVQAYREKRRAKKEEKRRNWLRD